MAKFPDDIRRVWVALSGAEDEWASLDAAADLAARLQAELTTLFIEDADLLRASLLPCVREIGRLSAQSRQLEFGQVERSLKAAAISAELRLRRLAETRALRFSFQVLRGRPVPQLLSLAGRLDLVLLAPAAWQRRRQADNRPIAVLYDASAEAEQALALAAGLARDTGSPLHVLIPAHDDTTFRQQWAQAREHVPGWVVTGERCADLAEQANRITARVLVLHAASGFDAPAIARLRSRMHSDLLLLR